MTISGWELLEQGRFTDAITRLQEEFEATGSKVIAYNLAAAYLCVGDVSSAKQRFGEIQRKRSAKNAATFEFVGVCCWLQGSKEEAVVQWIDGLDAEYADVAGGIQLPLLLFFAAVREPTSISAGQVKSFIQTKLRHPWSSKWPGPLGRYVIGEMSFDEINRLTASHDENVALQRRMCLDFYTALLSLADQHDLKSFRERMNDCSQSVRCVLRPEWHLARFEANSKVDS